MALVPKSLNSVTISTAGTAQRITSDNLTGVAVIIQADSANTGVIYVGDANVDSTNGIRVVAGNTYTISAGDLRGTTEEIRLNAIWVDTATAGNVAYIQYLKRE